MNSHKRKKLAVAGFRIGDAEDFLELTQEERGLVELRVATSRALRRQRELMNLTQQQLATIINSSQSRVAKMEAGSADASLDLLFRGLFAVGGSLADLIPASRNKRSSSKRTKPPVKSMS